jgi:hypothetical protein
VFASSIFRTVTVSAISQTVAIVINAVVTVFVVVGRIVIVIDHIIVVDHGSVRDAAIAASDKDREQDRKTELKTTTSHDAVKRRDEGLHILSDRDAA